MSNTSWKEQLQCLCKKNSIVTNQQILSLLPDGYHLKFEELMRGKTCPLLDNRERGVYSWDLEQFLNKL